MSKSNDLKTSAQELKDIKMKDKHFKPAIESKRENTESIKSGFEQ